MNPIEVQLEQVKLTLAQTVLATPQPYLRHYRFRPTSDAERKQSPTGCIAIRFDDNSPDTDSNESLDIQKQRLGVTLVYDYPTPFEDDDPTGFGGPLPILMAAVRALRVEDSPMLQTADEVLMGELIPAEESAGDSARLEQRLIVVYRVNSVDPTILYAQGA